MNNFKNNIFLLVFIMLLVSCMDNINYYPYKSNLIRKDTLRVPLYAIEYCIRDSLKNKHTLSQIICISESKLDTYRIVTEHNHAFDTSFHFFVYPVKYQDDTIWIASNTKTKKFNNKRYPIYYVFLYNEYD